MGTIQPLPLRDHGWAKSTMASPLSNEGVFSTTTTQQQPQQQSPGFHTTPLSLLQMRQHQQLDNDSTINQRSNHNNNVYLLVHDSNTNTKHEQQAPPTTMPSSFPNPIYSLKLGGNAMFSLPASRVPLWYRTCLRGTHRHGEVE